MTYKPDAFDRAMQKVADAAIGIERGVKLLRRLDQEEARLTAEFVGAIKEVPDGEAKG